MASYTVPVQMAIASPCAFRCQHVLRPTCPMVTVFFTTASSTCLRLTPSIIFQVQHSTFWTETALRLQPQPHLFQLLQREHLLLYLVTGSIITKNVDKSLCVSRQRGKVYCLHSTFLPQNVYEKDVLTVLWWHEWSESVTLYVCYSVRHAREPFE